MDAYGNYTAGLVPTATTTSGVVSTSRVYSREGVPGVDYIVPVGYDLVLDESTGNLYSLTGGVWVVLSPCP